MDNDRYPNMFRFMITHPRKFINDYRAPSTEENEEFAKDKYDCWLERKMVIRFGDHLRNMRDDLVRLRDVEHEGFFKRHWHAWKK